MPNLFKALNFLKAYAENDARALGQCDRFHSYHQSNGLQNAEVAASMAWIGARRAP